MKVPKACIRLKYFYDPFNIGNEIYSHGVYSRLMNQFRVKALRSTTTKSTFIERF